MILTKNQSNLLMSRSKDKSHFTSNFSIHLKHITTLRRQYNIYKIRVRY